MKLKKRKFKSFIKLLFTICGVVMGFFGCDATESVVTDDVKIQLSESIVESTPDDIPDFSGEDYIVLNDNQPSFNNADFKNITGEHYSNLDWLGRCGTATAMLHRSMMPIEERGVIGQIKPSGWKQAKYAGYVEAKPPYLYNRCHLIAYALTGQNANEKNLITGTNISKIMNYWHVE